MKLGKERADRELYERVGRRFGISGATAAKETSKALSGLRKWAAFMLARDLTLSAGHKKEEHSSSEHVIAMIIGMAVSLTGLPEEKVRGLLFGPLFEK